MQPAGGPRERKQVFNPWLVRTGKAQLVGTGILCDRGLKKTICTTEEGIWDLGLVLQRNKCVNHSHAFSVHRVLLQYLIILFRSATRVGNEFRNYMFNN